MGRKAITKFKFKVLNKTWELHLVNKTAYAKSNGPDSVAITHVYKRVIELSPFGRDKETIIHELVHAYLSELCVHTANLDEENLEEVFAELMSKRGYELLALSDTLYDKIRPETGKK